jgi:uncharacterized protein YndB with AHSA1/START domain
MSFDLNVERLMDCTPDEAYDAFLDREGLADWYELMPSWTVDVVAHAPAVGGTTSVEFGDPEVGWRCREDMTYRELDRPRRIVYDQVFTGTRGDERSSYETVVSLTFEDHDGKTLLSLYETGYPDASERDAHQNGWPSFLENVEIVAIKRRGT